MRTAVFEYQIGADTYFDVFSVDEEGKTFDQICANLRAELEQLVAVDSVRFVLWLGKQQRLSPALEKAPGRQRRHHFWQKEERVIMQPVHFRIMNVDTNIIVSKDGEPLEFQTEEEAQAFIEGLGFPEGVSHPFLIMTVVNQED